MILIQEEKALDSCSMMNVCYLKIGTRLALDMHASLDNFVQVFCVCTICR